MCFGIFYIFITKRFINTHLDILFHLPDFKLHVLGALHVNAKQAKCEKKNQKEFLNLQNKFLSLNFDICPDLFNC
jgi:hypothetical protein